MKEHSVLVSWALTSTSLILANIKVGMIAFVTAIDIDSTVKVLAGCSALISMSYTAYKFYKRVKSDLNNIDNESEDKE